MSTAFATPARRMWSRSASTGSYLCSPTWQWESTMGVVILGVYHGGRRGDRRPTTDDRRPTTVSNGLSLGGRSSVVGGLDPLAAGNGPNGKAAGEELRPVPA